MVKRVLITSAAILLMLCIGVYLCTGNICGHEFNRLFPEVPVSHGVAGKPLSGKEVVCIGDSIIGMTRTGTSVTAYLAKETGATVYNAGFGGTRMSKHTKNGYGAFSMYLLADAIVRQDWELQERYVSQASDYFPAQLQSLKQIDFSTVDIMIIHFGTNDFTASPGIDPDNMLDPLDCGTTAGALRYSIQRLQEAFPQLQIYVSLPLFRYWPESKEFPDTYRNDLGKLLDEYIQAIRQAAEDCGVPVIDGSSEMGMNQQTVSRFTLDGVHLSRAGRKRFSGVISSHLNQDAIE